MKTTVLTSLLVCWSCTSSGGSVTIDSGSNDASNASIDASVDAVDAMVEASCSGEVTPKGERVLGFDILNLSESGSFEENITLAKSAGVGFIALHVLWSDIETAPSTYTDPGGALGALSAVAAANNLKFSITIRPIDLTGKTVPTDLGLDPMGAHRFNTDLVKNRFTTMLDYILTDVVDPAVVLNLQVGNEIDGYDSSSEHPDFWSDYGDFLFHVNNHVDTNYSNLPVGFTVTYGGATSGALHDQGVWTALAGVVDVIGVTYYPQDAQFQVLDPSVVAGQLTTLVEEFESTGKPIYLQEVGYQTSAENASSEAQQAQFFCEFFGAWDTHREAIVTANLVRLNDISEDEAAALAQPYAVPPAQKVVFEEYLRTLGLRHYAGDGTAKEAYSLVVDEATKRGF